MSWELFAVWRCETTISFVTFIAALSLTHYTDSHTLRRLARDDSFFQLPRCPAAMFPLLLLLMRGAYYAPGKKKKRLKTSEFIGKIIWKEVTLCLRLARAWTIYSSADYPVHVLQLWIICLTAFLLFLERTFEGIQQQDPATKSNITTVFSPLFNNAPFVCRWQGAMGYLPWISPLNFLLAFFFFLC